MDAFPYTEDVRASVINDPDGILLANIMNKGVTSNRAVANSASSSDDDNSTATTTTTVAPYTKALWQFRYGPGENDYPRPSIERWKEYQTTRPCGGEYCDSPSFERQQRELSKRQSAKTVASASRIANICTLPPLAPTPYLRDLVDAALKNLQVVALDQMGLGDDEAGGDGAARVDLSVHDDQPTDLDEAAGKATRKAARKAFRRQYQQQQQQEHNGTGTDDDTMNRDDEDEDEDKDDDDDVSGFGSTDGKIRMVGTYARLIGPITFLHTSDWSNHIRTHV